MNKKNSAAETMAEILLLLFSICVFFLSRRSHRARLRKMEEKLTEIIGAVDARGATQFWWCASSSARQRVYQLPAAPLLAAAPCLSAPQLEAPRSEAFSVAESPGQQQLQHSPATTTII